MTHVATEQIVPSTRNRRKRFQFIAIPFVRDDGDPHAWLVQSSVTSGDYPGGKQRRHACRRRGQHFRRRSGRRRARRSRL